MSKRPYPAAQSGVTMIEVLITLVILLLGLLGLAGLQAKAQLAETESYQRVQALVLLRDMADRVNANRAAAASYVTPWTAPLGTASTTYSSTSDCNTLGSLAGKDLCYWDKALKGSAETSGGNRVGAMLGARGCITSPAANQYLIEVVWQGLAATAKPPDSVGCGSGSYDGTADLTRRAVTTLVQIGTLP